MTMKFGQARDRLITPLNIWEMILLVVSSYLHQINVHNLFTIEPGQIVSLPTGSLYGHI